MNQEEKHSSVEVGLLHDPEKLFLVDFTVTVSVCFINHLLQLLVRQALAQLLCNPLQVLEADFPLRVEAGVARGGNGVVCYSRSNCFLCCCSSRSCCCCCWCCFASSPFPSPSPSFSSSFCLELGAHYSEAHRCVVVKELKRLEDLLLCVLFALQHQTSATTGSIAQAVNQMSQPPPLSLSLSLFPLSVSLCLDPLSVSVLVGSAIRVACT